MARRVILVTGASTGIGHASALALVDAGYVVYGSARRVHLMDDIVDSGGHSLEMDVTDHASVRAGVDRIIAEQGRIDGLFANAGYSLLGPVETLPIDEVTKQFDTNVIGVGRAIKAALPHMRAQGGGTIAICSSAAGHVALPGMAWYPSTKFALQGLADGLRPELDAFGILRIGPESAVGHRWRRAAGLNEPALTKTSASESKLASRTTQRRIDVLICSPQTPRG